MNFAIFSISPLSLCSPLGCAFRYRLDLSLLSKDLGLSAFDVDNYRVVYSYSFECLDELFELVQYVLVALDKGLSIQAQESFPATNLQIFSVPLLLGGSVLHAVHSPFDFEVYFATVHPVA